jgi:hypothetical protein
MNPGRLAALIVLFLAGVVVAAGQSREPTVTRVLQSGTLTGTVLTDTSTPRPVVRATVRLTGAGATVRVIGTDEAGRFRFDGLPAGRFTISAEKPGLVRAFHGSTDPGRGPGVPVAIANGETADITIRLLPGAVITGTIIDTSGRPAMGIPVAASNVRPPAGLAPTSVQGVTDDRGVYRLFGLPPGEYLVSALPRIVGAAEGRGGPAGSPITAVTESDVQWAKAALAAPGGQRPQELTPAGPRVVAYAPVFYPGTTDVASVAAIRVASGEERSGVDMALRIVPLSRLSGLLTDANGQSISSAQVLLVPKRGDQPSPVDGLIASGALPLPRATFSASRFTFAGVAPGQYTLVARNGSGQRGAPPEIAATTLWNVTDVTVTGTDRDDLMLRLTPGLTLAGRIVFEAGSIPPVDPASLNLSLVAVSPFPGFAATFRASVERDGIFRVANLMPGSYLIRSDVPAASAAARWTLKSAVLNGRDLADQPIAAGADAVPLSGAVVTFTDRAAEITGHLVDASGRAVTRYSVVVFPRDRALWTPASRRIRAVRPATDGAFSVTGLPAGAYAIAAVEHAEDAALTDAAFISQLLASSVAVTLGDGERKTQDLRAQ